RVREVHGVAARAGVAVTLRALLGVDRSATRGVTRRRDGPERLGGGTLTAQELDDARDRGLVEWTAELLAVARHRRARAAGEDRLVDVVVGRALEERRVDERRSVVGLVALGVVAVALRAERLVQREAVERRRICVRGLQSGRASWREGGGVRGGA